MRRLRTAAHHQRLKQQLPRPLVAGYLRSQQRRGALPGSGRRLRRRLPCQPLGMLRTQAQRGGHARQRRLLRKVGAGHGAPAASG